MDKIPIPEQDVVALDSVGSDVSGLRVLIVNVFAIARPSGEWMLVDCGLPHQDSRIRRWTEEQFGKGARPEAILLTHGHSDHTGSVEDLASQWDVPVYAHPLELPYVTGQKSYPPPDPSVGGGLMSLLSKLFPRDPVDLGSRARPLPESGEVPAFPEWRWIHTPGHTPGHVSFFRELDRLLIVGDALSTTKQESFMAVALQSPEIHGPPAYMTTDWDRARESVEQLSTLRPQTIAAGHGRPLSGPDVADALAVLARDFDRVARPTHGRYVDHPAA
ncbi:MAG TPA: MBL fold metallo-hydrolase [Bryobacteraceae bacterium]|jgi:glyoxylase-like metal-dependent hydrolase (beta-lactamase superfamily II)|nr:MBL fold metallo-hydrolase [Bryobacteraceae bacterium]HWE53577.1 MBL fold metallo-hydrolase [Bryobacteraceae bacterium]